MCAIGCKILILIMLFVVLVLVFHSAGYVRYFAVWVCGFVNCVKYFDDLIVFEQLEKKTVIHPVQRSCKSI